MRELRVQQFIHVSAEKDFQQGDNRIVVDVYGEKNGVVVFVEIEERRRAPLQNVAKIVQWVSKTRRHTRVTLVHIFSQEFYGKKQHRGEEQLARFVGQLGGQLFSDRFQYVAMRVSMATGHRFVSFDRLMGDVARLVAEKLSSGHSKELENLSP